MPTAGDYLIRCVRESDLEPLSDLEESIFEKNGYPYLVLRQMFDVHQSHWLVADRGGMLCGYALTAPCSGREAGWVLGLGVHPDHRRVGIGSALLNQSLDLFRAASVRWAYLTVKPKSVELIRLYRLAGFRVESFEPNYLGPGEDRLVMAKRLDG